MPRQGNVGIGTTNPQHLIARGEQLLISAKVTNKTLSPSLSLPNTAKYSSVKSFHRN